MPYDSIADLPEDVRERLTKAQQRAYVEAFNEAEERGWSEERCHAYAEGAAKQAAGKEADAMGLTAQDLRDLADMVEFRESKKAEWSTAYINDLPDSAFLYIAPGGEKDDEGKTTPRDLRYFPYKNADGEVDLPHLRNAISRAPQADLPDSVIEEVQAKARRILDEQKEAADQAEIESGMALKYDDERQIVYGVVYEPHVVDTQGEFAGEDAILDAAHEFMLGGAKMKLAHAEKTEDVAVVENYVAPVDFELNGETVRKGSWVMATKVFDAELWQEVRKGGYGGYSFGADVIRQRGGQS